MVRLHLHSLSGGSALATAEAAEDVQGAEFVLVCVRRKTTTSSGEILLHIIREFNKTRRESK